MFQKLAKLEIRQSMSRDRIRSRTGIEVVRNQRLNLVEGLCTTLGRRNLSTVTGVEDDNMIVLRDALVTCEVSESGSDL